jgi:endonuclease YncB( thermonuclease family)
MDLSANKLGLLLLLLLTLVSSALKSEPPVSGLVTAIEDGDKLVIVTEDKQRVKVRLKGIDAPENAQPFFREAADNLRRLSLRKYAALEGTKIDRYGYLVAKVLIGNTDACLEQIRAGYAWHFKRYESEQTEQDRKSYAQAEQEARKEKRGLWQAPTPEPPWTWQATNGH